MAPENCPNCGADLPPNARACPECGSDEWTGWSDASERPQLDLPEENFDYDDFVRREFSGTPEVKPAGVPWFWWGVAVLLLLAFASGWFLFLR